jgi:hypothetical protein
MANFRKVEMTIKRSNGYSQYLLQAEYKGKFISVRTNDSEMFDWLEDDSNRVKNQEAKQRAYSLIRHTFEQ